MVGLLPEPYSVMAFFALCTGLRIEEILALDWKKIPHVRRTLGPDYLPRVWWATGRGTLPVLWLDGKAIGDSTRILEAPETSLPASLAEIRHRGASMEVAA